jgi:hypothetical protein
MDDDLPERANIARRGSPYLNTPQAAHFLSLSTRTLEKFRATGKGPKWRRHTHFVQYHVDDLIAWSEGRARSLEP